MTFVEDYQDSTGEDALEVYVILDNATRDDERGWQQLKPVFEAIQDVLRRAGEPRFAYITAGTRIEFDRRFAYDAEEDDGNGLE